MLTHKELKSRALERADVKAEYDRLDEEFTFLDEFLKARAAAGITQAEIARRIGTTQSASARLESGGGKHSPSLATLEKYAHALGCRLELRLVNEAETQTQEAEPLAQPGARKNCAPVSSAVRTLELHMHAIKSLITSKFSGRSINLKNEQWHHGVPNKPGWYFVETDAPLSVLTALPSPPSEYTNEDGELKTSRQELRHWLQRWVKRA